MQEYELVANLLKDRPRVVLLHGEMGAGKTTFVQGVLKLLGVKDAVTSPTFTIINQYEVGDQNFFHADLYRIKDQSELLNTDFFEILGGKNVFFVEWPYNNVDKKVYKNIDAINIKIEVISETERKITID
ncbi:MAG: tRNA (adenosine(37)-N6)-threonylcarbamoyltransferase complex ATPase subunit type 1 TsaE [Firmicutes bacterium]|nr:tRNA (adenosine(37)-N6)-threonylcarbamoyltransferase complex ATPase subunit type 1 TsaE [Bacillota bacterium]